MRLCVAVLAIALASVSTPVGGGSAVASDPMVGAPTVGQCFNHEHAAILEATVPAGEPVECAQRHTTVVAGVVPLPDHLPLTGDTEKTFDYLSDQCRPAYESAVGVPHKLQHIDAFTNTLYLPSQELVAQGARWGRCDVVSIVGTSLVPIAASTPLITYKPYRETARCLRTDYSVTTCDRQHAWAPITVLTLRGSTFPSRAAQLRFGQRRCGAITGVATRTIFYTIPRATWQDGERHMVCWGSDRQIPPPVDRR